MSFLIFKLALRNLIRNRTRSFLNLSMIIGAFASIVLFKGFAFYILKSAEYTVTKGNTGHIQIAKSTMWNNQILKNKEENYIQDYQKIDQQLSELQEVKQVSGRASLYSLISNGDKSVGAHAIGFDPSAEPNVEETLLIIEGSGFTKQSTDNSQAKVPDKMNFEVLVGAGLQEKLQLKMGQSLSLVSQTLAGAMSSIEPEVRGIFSTGMREFDSSTIYLNLAAAQELLGTVRAERLVVLLNENASLLDSKTQIQKALNHQPELVVKDWRETATFYREISNFYVIQNSLVELILSCLVFFGVLNTVGLSIYERIGEIGTMRALGDQRHEILNQFLVEGLLMGIFGSIFAIPVSFLLASGVTAMHIQLLMPGATRSIPMVIQPQWVDCGTSAIILTVICLISIFWPAHKALRISIVDALRANS